MSLDGLAMAIYKQKDDQNVISSTVLTSNDDGNIFIQDTKILKLIPMLITQMLGEHS